MSRYIDTDKINYQYLPIPAIGDQFVTKLTIDNMPVEDVAEVKHGKWVDTDCSGYLHNPIYECSVCHKQVEDYYIHKHNFCLHCGAKMDLGGEE